MGKKNFNKKEFGEKLRKHSGEIIIALIALVLLIALLSVSVPFLSDLFNKDTDKPTEIITSSIAEPEHEPAHKHSYSKNKTINPACTEKGYSVYLCSCGDTYNADYIDALGHDWGEWVVTKQPTEEKEGVETRTCERCGITENRSIDKLKPQPQHEHSYSKNKTINPTCTEKGYSVYLCSCGDTYNADYTDALGHNWGEWIVTKTATEDEEGTETRTCERCGITENRSINKLPHSHAHAVDSIIKPTCTEKGYSVYLCKCGDTYKADYTDALGHDWSAWVVTKQPTEATEGTETRSCERCGITEDRSIDKLPVEPPKPGDIYEYGDYEYCYGAYYMETYNAGDNKWIIDEKINGWGVHVKNHSYKYYGEILSTIKGKPVTSLKFTFDNCKNLIEAPVIPDTVTDMFSAFCNCKSMKIAPVIPDSVTNLWFTFEGCEVLKTYHGSSDPDGDFSSYVIPDGVTVIDAIFCACDNITHAPAIPGSVTSMRSAFYNCEKLLIGPDMSNAINIEDMYEAFSRCKKMTTAPNISNCTKLKTMINTFEYCQNLKTYHGSTDPDGDFSGYILPNSVTNMNGTFCYCTYMTKAPTIPASVKIMQKTFFNCPNLTGTITIDAQPTHYDICFGCTSKPIKIIGACADDIKAALAATATSGNVSY